MVNNPTPAVEVNLLPCPNPWCGSHDQSDAEIFAAHRPIVVPAGAVYMVCCPVCPLNGPRCATECAAAAAWNTRTPSRGGEVQKLREALTPSGDTKAAYLGEFKFDVMFPSLDEDDDEPVPHPVTVPWDTIKQIMAAILARAALASPPPVEGLTSGEGWKPGPLWGYPNVTHNGHGWPVDAEGVVIAARRLSASPATHADDDRRTIEILSRALAWHGDLQRMATTREEWQQAIDDAIAWVKANPEPDRPSFSTWANAATHAGSVREAEA